MRRILGSLVGVVGVALIVLAFLLVNGGYIYETKCPLASGGTQKSWTYAIDDLVPYIRQTSAPCTSHSGTRLALSAVGIWPKTRSIAALAASRAHTPARAAVTPSLKD
jgi:hypothetical protein